MKKQITHFSPHQNAKVFAVLMAVSSLVFLLPMFVVMLFVAPRADATDNTVAFHGLMLLIMPLFYLVFGYISVAVGCLIYNSLVKFIGGIEFEIEE